MKILITSILLCLTNNLLGQSTDSIIYESESVLLTKNYDKNRFVLVNKKSKEIFENLLFAKWIFHYIQILDANGSIFYVDENWNIKQDVNDFSETCNKSHNYKLSAKVNPTNFEILQAPGGLWTDEIKIAATVKLKIDKKKADSILFINGKNKYDYNAGYFADVIGITDPQIVILVKDGKYFINDNPNLKFDSIDFTDYYHSLKTMKDNLYGLLGVFEPKYKRIDKFNYYLAEAETSSGEVIFIDIDGNEYKLVDNTK